MLEHLGICPLKTFPLAEWCECKWGVCCRFAAIFERFICFWRFLMRERGVAMRSRSDSYAFVQGISVGEGRAECKLVPTPGGLSQNMGLEMGKGAFPAFTLELCPAMLNPFGLHFVPRPSAHCPQQWSNEIVTIMVAMACTWANGVQSPTANYREKKKNRQEQLRHN